LLDPPQQIIQPHGMRLNLPLFKQMNHIGNRRIHGDRYADLFPQLRHITVDEVYFRSPAPIDVTEQLSSSFAHTAPRRFGVTRVSIAPLKA
jgi:hypothetical protein